jgi:hypothetical protein
MFKGSLKTRGNTLFAMLMDNKWSQTNNNNKEMRNKVLKTFNNNNNKPISQNLSKLMLQIKFSIYTLRRKNRTLKTNI